MIVVKLGGTSVGSGERFAAAAELVLERRCRGCLAVVSAMGKVTRELHDLARLAVAGELGEARARLAAVGDRHRAALGAAGVPTAEAAWVEEALAAELARVEGLLAVAARERLLAPPAWDEVLATGELLSSRLLTAVLRGRGARALWVDPRDLVVTDDRFGRARPDEAAIADRVARVVRPALEQGELVVTGGFVGREPGGATTILGWEASDYSATLLGAALPAEWVEIFSDVDGVFTADPRLVPTARLIPVMSYREAADLAFFGAKVLHPATMEPIARRGIPLTIRNSFRPDGAGTLVTSGAAAEAGPRGVAALAQLGAADLRAVAVAACGARLLDAADGSEAVRAALDGQLAMAVARGVLPDPAALDRLRRGRERAAGLALVSVVGGPGAHRLSARTAAALDGLPVLPLAAAGCDTHHSFALPETLRVEALQRLDRALFAEAAW